MVKALVFGTKDLCVRIAPWSKLFGLLYLHIYGYWFLSRRYLLLLVIVERHLLRLALSILIGLLVPWQAFATSPEL